MDEYNVFVQKDSFKFTAAHFIAFKGFREYLHGHNYTVSVRLHGQRSQNDGYVVDFGNIKKLVTDLCKELNQKVLLPEQSDVLDFTMAGRNIEITCEDGSFFSFPKQDCMLLPVVHTSAEEIAEHLMSRMIKRFDEIYSEGYLLKERGIKSVELSVSEAPSQTATCIRYLQTNNAMPTSKSNCVGCSCNIHSPK